MKRPFFIAVQEFTEFGVLPHKLLDCWHLQWRCLEAREIAGLIHKDGGDRAIRGHQAYKVKLRTSNMVWSGDGYTPVRAAAHGPRRLFSANTHEQPGFHISAYKPQGVDRLSTLSRNFHYALLNSSFSLRHNAAVAYTYRLQKYKKQAHSRVSVIGTNYSSLLSLSYQKTLIGRIYTCMLVVHSSATL